MTPNVKGKRSASSSSYDSECSDCQNAKIDKRLYHHKKGQRHHNKIPMSHYAPQ